jgi:hypothetical protein
VSHVSVSKWGPSQLRLHGEDVTHSYTRLNVAKIATQLYVV